MVNTKTPDFSSILTEAAFQVLIEVLYLLKEFENSLILVGGWVPILLLPDASEKHVGTVDVDIAIDGRALSESGSKTIEDILLGNGYLPGGEPGRYIRTIKIKEQEIDVPVDFLVGEHGFLPDNELFDITGVRPITAPGSDLAFDSYEKIKIEGKLQNGSKYSAEIKSASIVSFLVMKAHVLNVREKSKDAYDIWFCLANHPDGIESIATAFEPHLGRNSVKIAFSIMAEYFSDVKAKGPEMVIEEEGTKDPELREFLRQDAYQRVNDLLMRLNRRSG